MITRLYADYPSHFPHAVLTDQNLRLHNNIRIRRLAIDGPYNNAFLAGFGVLLSRGASRQQQERSAN
jgi:hypothetical protein